MGVADADPLSQLSLPPGFRFYPTDEELMVQYLCRKIAGHHFPLQIIGEIDLYKFDPWVLPSMAMFGEKEWYFFSPRDRKYPNGSRPNRVAGSGYWKATGTDKVITTEGRRVGIKKALVFYVGKAPKGTKTNWIMHEYRISEPHREIGSQKLDDWVLCRIYKKNSGGQQPIPCAPTEEQSRGSTASSTSQSDDILELPEVHDWFFTSPGMNSLRQNNEKLNLQSLTSGNIDWPSLAGVVTSVPEFIPGGQVKAEAQTQGYMNTIHNVFNDSYVPSIPPACHVDSPCVKFGLPSDEVQKRVESSFLQRSTSGFAPTFYRSTDPCNGRYPTQRGGLFGLQQ